MSEQGTIMVPFLFCAAWFDVDENKNTNVYVSGSYSKATSPLLIDKATTEWLNGQIDSLAFLPSLPQACPLTLAARSLWS